MYEIVVKFKHSPEIAYCYITRFVYITRLVKNIQKMYVYHPRLRRVELTARFDIIEVIISERLDAMNDHFL